jgi:hypothetical protein
MILVFMSGSFTVSYNTFFNFVRACPALKHVYLFVTHMPAR